MTLPSRRSTRCLFGWAAAWAATLSFACVPALAAGAADAPGSSPESLRALHQKKSVQLAQSRFGQPVLLDSIETDDGLQGDVYAVVDHPLADVAKALEGSGHWCEMLLLHVNNRRCRATKGAQGVETLTLFVVRRYDMPVDDAFELPFAYRQLASTPEHVTVQLASESGPMGTGHYRVVLEAVAISDKQAFVHFSYSYEHNMMARLASQAYLATFGSEKVGFTVVGKQADGSPDYIRGLRGLVERNSIRYFLTLDAYLDGIGTPPAQQHERRLKSWFTSIERYPRQLHEFDWPTYLALKRADRERDGVPGAH